MTVPVGLPIRQVASVINDIEEAATRHRRLSGSGPFFKFDKAERSACNLGREITRAL